MKLFTLGRNPQLSLAELTSLHGRAELHSPKTAVLEDTEVDFDRLGGSIKCGTANHKLQTTKTKDIWEYLSQNIESFLNKQNTQQNLGVSFYGIEIDENDYKQQMMSLKQAAQDAQLKVRVVLPQSGTTLSSAEVFHNQLADNGTELLVSVGKNKTLIAQTTQVQNIDRYRHRDRGRPKADPKVGLLPPKLAQIMLNLANPEAGGWVLDPFCGSGVILQEAMLSGFNAYGSDIDPRMQDFTQANLSWLRREFNIDTKFEVIQADARSHRWSTPIAAVVSELDLGPPLKKAPSSGHLQQLARKADQLIEDFLVNLAPQLSAHAPLCIAVPAWLNTEPPTTPNVIDQLGDFGYNYKRLKGVDPTKLIYRRSNQHVGRKLLVLEKD